MDLSTARATLGLDHDSTASEVREAYLDLVKVWHPDRFPTDSRLRRKAEDRLKEINEAYALLSGVAPSPPRRPPSAPPPAASPDVAAAHTVPPESAVSGILDRWTEMSLLGRLAVVIGGFLIVSIVFESINTPNGIAPAPTQLPVNDARPALVPGTTPGLVVNSPTSVSRQPVALNLNCDPELTAIPPRSGAEIGGGHRGGLGSLHIKNGSESEAIAVMVDERTRVPTRAIYIRRGETGILTSIPVGEYRVQFQFGEMWLKSKRFCRISGTSEFENLMQFEERDTGDATEFSRFELTLYTVTGGNARTDDLPNTPLALPDQ